MQRCQGRKGSLKKKLKKIDMSKIQCYECNENGHFRRNCPKLKKENKKRNERNKLHATEEIKELEKKKTKEEVKDLYYD